MSLMRWLAWGLLALLVGCSLWAWPRLPAEVPVDFGLAGVPGAWGPRSLRSWFALPAVGVGLALLIEGAGALMRRRPALVNLPDGRTLDDLPREEHGPVLRVVRGLLAWVLAELVVVLGLVQLAFWRSAHGAGAGGLLLAALLLSLLSSPFFLAVFFLSLQRALDRAQARIRARPEQA